MNIFEAISTISYTREFHKDPVDEKEIGLILHMGSHAPSAGELQEWEFIVVEDQKKKDNIAEACFGAKHVKTAPALIVVCADVRKAALKYGKRGEMLYAAEDVGGCVAYMAVAANAIGVGFDIIKGFDEEDIKLELNMPENIRPIVVMPLGYPLGHRKDRPINPFENVTYVNRYDNKIHVEFQPVLDMIEKKLGKKI